MAINRSKIARQLLAAGGVSFESPRRAGFANGSFPLAGYGVGHTTQIKV